MSVESGEKYLVLGVSTDSNRLPTYCFTPYADRATRLADRPAVGWDRAPHFARN